MSSLSMFGTGARYVGDWSSATVYNQNEIVSASNGSAYRCKVSGATGVGQDPVTDTTRWEIYLPGGLPGFTTATQEVRASTTTYGIAAGSTWVWRGQEWTLEKTGTQIKLVKMKQNCNCNCDCDCDWIDCDCQTTVNCTYVNCQCDCWSNCDCYSDCWCASDCGTNCNCATNCGTDCGQYYIPCYTPCDCYQDCWTPCQCPSNCDCESNCDCQTYVNCNPTNCQCDCSYQCDCYCTPV